MVLHSNVLASESSLFPNTRPPPSKTQQSLKAAPLARPKLVRNGPRSMKNHHFRSTMSDVAALNASFDTPKRVILPTLAESKVSHHGAESGTSRLFSKYNVPRSSIGHHLLHESFSSSSSIHDLDSISHQPSPLHSSLSTTPLVVVAAPRGRAPLMEVMIDTDEDDAREYEIRVAGLMYLDDDISVSSDMSCDDRLEAYFFDEEDRSDEVHQEDVHDQMCFGTFMALKSGLPLPDETFAPSKLTTVEDCRGLNLHRSTD